MPVFSFSVFWMVFSALSSNLLLTKKIFVCVFLFCAVIDFFITSCTYFMDAIFSQLSENNNYILKTSFKGAEISHIPSVPIASPIVNIPTRVVHVV